MFTVLAFWLAWFGCRTADDEDGNEPVDCAFQVWPDADGDGYGDDAAKPIVQCDVEAGFAAQAGDCDDTDAAISPAADEDCSNVDRNCDGQATEGAMGTLWYRDGDGDGYGNGEAQMACVAPADHVARDGDCDDGDASVNPGASEWCNEVDDDCDGSVDNDAADVITQYLDADADGFGVESVTVTACPAEPGYAPVPGDCNDKDASIAPDQPDRCNDGIDDDCDPKTDENVVSGAAWFADLDLDGFGAGTAAVACEAPSADLVADGTDCDDTDSAIFPGSPEICDDIDNDCDGQTDEEAADGTAYYVDSDLDGFGTGEALVACAPVVGRVTVDGDCDDANATVNPSAIEACDGLDNDCNPQTVDDDAPDAPAWVVDVDGDGFGDQTAKAVQSCIQPKGFVALLDATDCDDADALVNPGRPEVCNGGVDDDCDPTTDEEALVTWYADVDQDGYGDPGSTTTACIQPVGFVDNADDCDDVASDLNPIDTPGCIQDHCGTIDQSETWRNTVAHTVSCDVKVEGAAKPTLTVEPGVEVSFEPNTELRVGVGGDGRIVVDGDAAEVWFTSREPLPAAGDWDGLTIGSRDQSSVLTGLVVEYAGRDGIGGVRLYGDDIIVDRLTARYNANDGLHVDAGEPSIVGSTFTNNTGNGVTIDTSAGLSRLDTAGTPGPSFQNNVSTANLGRPLTLPGDVADEIDPNCLLTGNVVDAIELTSGTLRFTGTWADHGIPYEVRANATINVEDGPQAQLTIADGVEIVFDTSAGMRIGYSEAGQLIVDGHTEGVVMTGTSEIVALSDSWDGLTFGPNDLGSVVNGLLIEYGGSNAFGNLYLWDASPTFTNVVSRYADGDGLAVTGSSAAPSIADSRFEDNDEYGVNVASNSGLVPDTGFSGNVCSGNGLAPMVLPPDALGALDATSSFAGNGQAIQVHSGTVLNDATWSLVDETYEMTGTIFIGGPRDPVVTVEDGVHMTFARNTTFNVGTNDDGSLIVLGDETGVVMESAEPIPGEGDWYGMRVGANRGDATTALQGLTLRHAGGSDTGVGAALELIDTDGCGTQEDELVLEDLVIERSSKYALYAAAWSTLRIDGAVFTDNVDGCVYLDASSFCQGPTVTSFTGNTCTGSSEFGVWPLSEADALDETSVYPGPILFDDAALSTDVTLKNLGVPYHFLSSVTVGDSSGPVLTVESGNTLVFDFGEGLYVATSNSGGVVFEPGTPETTLTSIANSPAPGDWDGLRIGTFCTVADVEDVVLTYGGDNGVGSLYIDRCNVGGLIDRVTIEQSSTCGLYYDDGLSTMTVGTVQYAGNGTDVCP
ncbi:MAG: putative metal-binding motif-containing protein [Myxococcota bacterium]